MGARDAKIGITGHPAVRLGTYQIAYSRNSHIACFDRVYLGPARAIQNLEKAIKQRYDWNIERDGRGASEWVSNITPAEIEKLVDDLVEGYRFKIKKVPKKYLPLTVDNLEQFLIDHQLT
jgi:hypothetical protein